MNILKLKLIQRAIEDFFYRIRFNLALHKGITSASYNTLKAKIQEAIKKQILYFAKIEKVQEIAGIKKQEEYDEEAMVDRLSEMWIPLITLIAVTDLESYLTEAARRGGQVALDKLKVDQLFTVQNKDILKEISQRAKDVPLMVDETTQKWIASQIATGLKNGETPYEIAKTLRHKASDQAYERASLIAEHEMANMMGYVEEEVYKKSKVEYRKWVTSHDELVCPFCMANEDAGQVPVGDPFPSGAYSTPQHQRCRCLVLPVTAKAINVWTGK